MSVLRKLSLFCLAAFVLAGCVNNPVRHLASDAALITPGTSTKSDVLTYLGDPDERQEKAAEPERWLYYEEERSAAQRTFYIGKWFGPKSVSRVIITFDGDTVADIQYNATESGEFEETGSKSE